MGEGRHRPHGPDGRLHHRRLTGLVGGGEEHDLGAVVGGPVQNGLAQRPRALVVDPRDQLPKALVVIVIVVLGLVLGLVVRASVDLDGGDREQGSQRGEVVGGEDLGLDVAVLPYEHAQHRDGRPAQSDGPAAGRHRREQHGEAEPGEAPAGRRDHLPVLGQVPQARGGVQGATGDDRDEPGPQQERAPLRPSAPAPGRPGHLGAHSAGGLQPRRPLPFPRGQPQAHGHPDAHERSRQPQPDGPGEVPERRYDGNGERYEDQGSLGPQHQPHDVQGDQRGSPGGHSRGPVQQTGTGSGHHRQRHEHGRPRPHGHPARRQPARPAPRLLGVPGPAALGYHRARQPQNLSRICTHRSPDLPTDPQDLRPHTGRHDRDTCHPRDHQDTNHARDDQATRHVPRASRPSQVPHP